jgi:hypothetical protein
VIESKSFQLVSTKYRLPAEKAKALAAFLNEHVGRPEIFEIAVAEPDTITIIAAPGTQETIGKLVALIWPDTARLKTGPPKSAGATRDR